MRTELVGCALCADAVCSEACAKGVDPARAIRGAWFDDEGGEARRLAGASACAGCAAECSSACPKKLDVKGLVARIAAHTPAHEPEYARLRTELCGKPLENPFLLSSSVVASDFEMCLRAFDMGWAGVAFKTVSLMDVHEASPRFSALKSEGGGFAGLKNIEQVSDHSLVEDLGVFRRLKAARPDKFILASIMGASDSEWTFLARECESALADALELNFSCPHIAAKNAGSAVGECPEEVERLTRVVRSATKLPILVKLTPNVASMAPAAEAAIRGGADGIAAINTIKSVIALGHRDGETAVGGYSGRAVKPIALRFVSEVAKLASMRGKHLSGMGGIETWRDALDFIALGCTSVQMTTSVMEYGYRIIDQLRDGLASFLAERDWTMKDAIGMSLGSLKEIDEMFHDRIVLPRFRRDRCIGCGRCRISCRDGGHQAISAGKDRKPLLDARKCVGCHLCVLVCPEGAVTPSDHVIEAVRERTGKVKAFDDALRGALEDGVITAEESERLHGLIESSRPKTEERREPEG